jgi:hypothetical protein
MNRGDLQRLRVPIGTCLALVLAGAACGYAAHDHLEKLRAEAEAAAAQRAAVQARLARATDEEREIRANLQQYQALAASGIFAEEDRLHWVDTIGAIRQELRLFDIRYSIGPQHELDYPGLTRGGGVRYMASRVKIDIPLLHEQDLLDFIDAFARRSGSYLLPRSCDLRRESGGNDTGLAPRLHANCEFDLVRIRPAKSS